MFLYQNTIKKLAKALSQRLEASVQYDEHFDFKPSSGRKWFVEKDYTVIPLSLQLENIGYLKIQAVLPDEELDQVYHLVQWTLISLENVFSQYNVQRLNLIK